MSQEQANKNTNKLPLNKDKIAFSELYKKYSGPLYGFILSYTRNETAATDLVQESFARLFAAKVDLDTEARFRNYLYTIAVNLAKNKTRLKKETSPDSLNEKEEKGEEVTAGKQFEPDSMYEEHDVQQRVKQVIDELPDKERQVIMLKKVNGMTYEDIVKITNIPLRTLKRLVKKILEKLETRLREMGLVPEGLE